MAPTKFDRNSTNTSKFDLTFILDINHVISVAVIGETLFFGMKQGAMTKDLHYILFEKLENFRKQEKISQSLIRFALADDICEQLYQNKIGQDDIDLLLTKNGKSALGQSDI